MEDDELAAIRNRRMAELQAQMVIFKAVLWIRIRNNPNVWLDPNPKKKFGFGFRHCFRMKIFVKNQKSNI
jgi:hypothetical protein